MFNWHFQSPCVPLVFWEMENNVLVLFFVWNLQTVFSLKPMFSECPLFFLLFVCNDGALNLHLHVVALPVSVTMSWPTKSTYKLNMSGLDFLALVLQSSKSFDMNAFSSFFLFYFLLFTKSFFNWRFQSPCVPLVFWEMENNVLVLFFVWNLQTVFSLKPMFSECPLFFLLFVCNDGALNLHLQVLALSASVTMARPAKTSQKLNINTVNAVIPEKNLCLQKIWFSHSMENEKLMVNHLLDKGLRSF